ncbi:MAG: hypothetical protein HKO66_13050 [Saprospiraceae bacterium]|nr:hypothetical protein [Saprospiraceae bacterium]
MSRKNILLHLIGLITIGLISCSAMKQKPNNPSEELIQALLSGEDFVADGLTFNQPIDFDAIFVDRKNKSIYINSELRLSNCTFNEDIIWDRQGGRKLNFLKDVIFEECEFKKAFTLNDAAFKSQVSIGNCLFRNSLEMQRISSILKCRIDENDIGQDLILQYASFHEDLSLFTNTIGNNALLQSISVKGKSLFGNLSLNGSLDMSSSHFHEGLTMNYLSASKKVLLGSSKFYGSCAILYLKKCQSFDMSNALVLGKFQFNAEDENLKPSMTNVTILENNI